MEIDLQPFEQKIFSQNGEDGILVQLILRLYENPRNKYYVEFGVESGVECNTRILRDIFQWNGLQMDGQNENESIHLKKEYITKENILELFQKYDVPSHIQVLSVDIDFNDFYCLKQILSKYKCDIVICEYNGIHLPNEDKVVVYNSKQSWDGTNYFGASLLALEKLAKYYGYTLVYCESRGVNCFFVSNELLKEKKIAFKNMGDIGKIYRPARYGSGPNGGHVQDPYNRPYLSFQEAFDIC